MGDSPQRPQLPPDMKEFNRKLTEEFRTNRGQLTGPRAGMQVLLLTTVGARTGLTRTTVIGYRRAGNAYVAIASGNGAASHPAWYRNLLANPNATIEVGPDKLDVRARTAEGEERGKFGAAIEYLESQQKLTDREIPVVVFEPLDS